jgi:tetratricopeptide (TPR) repeat protein
VVYEGQGRHADAEGQWRQALAERPAFAPAWHGLCELFVGQGRWADLEEGARGLAEGAGEATEAAVFRARGHLARREFDEARGLLEAAAARDPRALWPRVVLSHALLQAEEWSAAEKALRAVLELDPGHAEARRNLMILLRQLGRKEAAAALLYPVTLEALYRLACLTPSDVNEHVPTLYALARECGHVTEFGTRTGVSTVALLYARPGKLVCYDKVRFPQVDVLQRLAGPTAFEFRQQDVLEAEIEETDLLFIDTWHVQEQLRAELRRHAGKVRRYVVLHDTTTYAEEGESPGHRGLWPAVEEFLALGTFRLKERYANNNGLTVLEAVPPGG